MVTIALISWTMPECWHQSDCCRPRAPPQACTRLDTRMWFTEAIDDAIVAVTREMNWPFVFSLYVTRTNWTPSQTPSVWELFVKGESSSPVQWSSPVVQSSSPVHH